VVLGLPRRRPPSGRMDGRGFAAEELPNKVLHLARPSGAASWRRAAWQRKVCLGRYLAAAGPRR
jgi:hypothetical protein